MQYYNSCGGIVYTIKEGDTLYSISGRFQVPVALILRANPLADIYNLQLGARLCIPMYGLCQQMCTPQRPPMPGRPERPQPPMPPTPGRPERPSAPQTPPMPGRPERPQPRMQ